MRGKYNSWKELKSLKTEEEKAKWIKNFCNKNGITSPRQLTVKCRGVYEYYSKLSKENKEKIFPPKYEDWSKLRNLKTEKEKVEWIINFCNKNDITLLTQLRIEFPGVYRYYKKLSKENKEKIFPPKYKDWNSELGGLSERELVDQIKNFCNKNNITSPSQLCIEFPGVNRYYRKLSKESREKIFPSKRKDWYSELGGLSEEEQVDWIKKLCNKNRITSARQLCIDYPRVCNGYYKKLSKKSREKIFPPKQKNWNEVRKLETEEKQTDWIKNFCDKHGITSPAQLSRCYGGLWLIYLDLSKENREKIFPPTISHGEETLWRLLTEGEYIFTTQKDFPDLKSNKGRSLYYDVFIPSKNCLVEYHGEQHFNPKCKYYSKEGIERDRIKHQYAIDHKINICYITECKIEYEEHGYFTSVFTSWNEAMEYINSLPDIEVVVEE